MVSGEVRVMTMRPPLLTQPSKFAVATNSRSSEWWWTRVAGPFETLIGSRTSPEVRSTTETVALSESAD